MATDSSVALKSYAESIGATTFGYKSMPQKVYIETIGFRGVFAYMLTSAKVYVEIIGPPTIVAVQRRMVSATIVQV
jgi:hypothetical protein